MTKIRGSRFLAIFITVFLITASSAATVHAGASCAKGSPVWSVNRINMNLYVTDIPLWYTPPVGPPVDIRISYNSQASVVANAPFGGKWQFSYGSSITEDVSGAVTVSMPDGRKDIYTPDGQGGYTKPFGIFSTLVKTAPNRFEVRLLDGAVYVYEIPAGTGLANPFLVQIKDAYNQALSIGYNTSGQLVSITDATAKVITLTYTNGRITSAADQFGRSATFEYTNGNLTRVVDMGGIWTNFAYETNPRDGQVYLSAIQNEKGTWTFKTEPDDGLSNPHPYPAPDQPMGNNYRLTITDPLGGKEEYYYYGPYTWHISPRDYVPYADANTNNYQTAVKTYFYLDRSNPKGRISKVQYPEGGYVEYADFDPATGEARTRRDYHGLDAGNNPIIHTDRYTYNPNGLVATHTDARNNQTTISYYPNNIDVQSITNGLGSISFTYNGQTRDVATITDRLGTVTAMTYNSNGRMASITAAQGTPLQSLTEFVYDPASKNLTGIRKAGNTVAGMTYDPIGRVKTQTDAAGLTIGYEYNSLNQVTRILYPDTLYSGTTPTSRFIDIQRSSCCTNVTDSVTDRAGLTTSYIHDALKRLTHVSGPDGSYEYQYDANGNLISLIDRNPGRSPSPQTSFEYNLDNLLTKKIFADGRFVEYTPDRMGLVKVFRSARNITKTYTYDPNHNLTGIDYSDSTPDVTFTYDQYNRPETRTDGAGLHQFTYDAGNRLRFVDGPWQNDTVEFRYNALGQTTDLIPQAGQPVSYVYDTIGRLTAISSPASSFVYGYNGVNPLIQSLTRPNGSFTEYQYNDPLKKLTAIINKNSSQEVINSFAYTYNSLDLKATETITNGQMIDNLVSGTTTYTPNILNQLANTANPNQAFAHDNDGNMTTGYTPEGYVLTMTYDAENRLKTAEYTDSSSVVHRTEYFYSGDNLLAQTKKYNNGVLQGDNRFVRGGFLPVQERDVSNLVTREYVWGQNMGGGIGGLLNMRQGGSDYAYLYDGKGNVTALLDPLQAVAGAYAYDPFGRVMKKAGTINQPYMFSTKEYDPETGLSYYGFRYYNASIGKWITRDPIEEEGGVNLYGFVGNNPVNFVDPLGLFVNYVWVPANKGVNPFGHAAININDTYYEVTKNRYGEVGALSKEEFYRKYEAQNRKPSEVPVYVPDEKAAEKYAKESVENKYWKYIYHENNCTSFTNEVIAAGGGTPCKSVAPGPCWTEHKLDGRY